MKPKDLTVAIIGGGVAGMSAAHELAERGFKVDLYEKQERYVGGKARSVDVPNTATGDRKPVPGEHGFRFFPGFYKHVTDTMCRIPYPGNKNGVLDNLVVSTREMMSRVGKPPIVSIVNFPTSLKDLKVLLHAINHADTGIPKDEVEFFALKMWQLITSSQLRRKEEYEHISWWEYIDAKNKSEAYQTYLAEGLTRTLVACRPQKMSTKTGGDILLQLMFLMAWPGSHPDRVLNGPTNDVWLWPWLAYLNELKVKFHHHHKLKKIHSDVKTERVTKMEVENLTSGEVIEVTADYYIMATPVEVMACHLTDNLKTIDPSLESLESLKEDTEWMNGMQFYLNEDVKLIRGHEIYVDSPWALTSISQIQFWDDFKISEYGNGEVKGILSVDISNWDNDGIIYCKPAKECTKEEIKEEVWEQIKTSLNVDGKEVLRDDMLIYWYLDRDIRTDGPHNCEQPSHKGFTTVNMEPLLVNRVNTWSLRPEAYTQVKNLMLASDYVRTYTDLATMEGANEAGRRATNAIIAISGVNAPLCKLWKLHEPFILAPLRWVDKCRFEKGLPWKNEFGWLLKLIHHLVHLLVKIVGFFKRLF